MATDAEARAAGFLTPSNQDMISAGDDAIRHNARTTLDLLAAERALSMIDGGIATAAAGPGGTADMLTANGTWWTVWGATQAAALELPVAAPGIVEAFTFGSGTPPVTVQRFTTAATTPSEIWVRNRQTDGWTAWARIGDGRLRTVPYALSAGNSGGTERAASRSFRLPFRLPATPLRFRVHIRNMNPRYGTLYAGALSFTGLGIQRHAGVVTLANEGQLASEPIALAGAFTTPANGAEWVSDWSAQPISTGEEWLLTGGYTCAEGQENFAGVSGGWITDSAADWNKPAPAGLRLTGAAPLFIWLELELPESVPVVAYYGDSLTVGLSSRLPVYDSYAYAHARQNGHVPVLYADSGSTMLAWMDYAAAPWNRYGTTQPRVDAVVFSMGSNDIFGGADVPTLKQRFEQVRRRFAARMSQNIIATTILPRHDSSDPAEAVRKEWNEHLTTALPGRVLAAPDTAAEVTAPDGATLDKRFSATPTDIHLTAAGYARFAAAIPPLHR